MIAYYRLVDNILIPNTALYSNSSFSLLLLSLSLSLPYAHLCYLSNTPLQHPLKINFLFLLILPPPLFTFYQMDLLLTVCGYSPLENHPTAHTPPLPLPLTTSSATSSSLPPKNVPKSIENKVNIIEHNHSKEMNRNKLRKRNNGNDIINDENYKVNAQQ